jgi:hypothetical protein
VPVSAVAAVAALAGAALGAKLGFGMFVGQAVQQPGINARASGFAILRWSQEQRSSALNMNNGLSFPSSTAAGSAFDGVFAQQ